MRHDGYTPISPSAVFSAIVAVVASLGLAFPQLMFLSIIGILVGIYSVRRMRRYEYRGQTLAAFGVVASLCILVAAPVWHLWLVDLESLPGYARVNFAAAANPASDSLDRYMGQNICLKGYAYPGPSQFMDRFALTVDGSNRDVKSMIWVTFRPGVTWK